MRTLCSPVHSADEPSPYANFDEEGVGCRLSYDEIGNICHKTVQVQDSQGPESSGKIVSLDTKVNAAITFPVSQTDNTKYKTTGM